MGYLLDLFLDAEPLESLLFLFHELQIIKNYVMTSVFR